MSTVCVEDEVPAPGEMLRRLRSGDQAVFNVLFARDAERLTRFVARIVNSPHVAADLVQDVFLRLWSRRAELEITSDIRSYLRRAARNRALDWLRREGLHREWEQTAVHEHSSWSADAPADQDRLARMQEVLGMTLAGMPPRRREVCELRWRKGLGPAVIAQQLGVSLKTVETHITLGMKDLRAGVSPSPVTGTR